MKKVFAITAAVCLLLGVGVAASAGTYTLHVPELEMFIQPSSGGFYYGNPCAIDFGREFSSIESVTLKWSGSGAGRQVWGFNDVRSASWGLAASLFDADHEAAMAYTDYLFGGTSFDQQNTFGGPLNSLLDGRAELRVNFTGAVSGYPYSFAQIDHAEIVVKGTAVGEPNVPEPSSLIAMLSGIGALGGFAIRRRK